MTKHPRARRILLVSRVSFVLACLACGNLDNIIVKKSASTTLQGSPLVLLTDLGFTEYTTIDVSDDATFKSKGFTLDDIDSVKIDSLTMEITAPPSGQDFTFITHVAFYASTTGQSPVLVASGGPFQAGLTSVGLNVEDVDLKPYAKAGKLTLTTEVSGHNPQNTTTIKATAAINIDVNVSHLVCGK